MSYSTIDIEQVIQSVLSTGRITRQDKQRFFTILASDCTLTDRQLAQVRTISDRLQMGLLKVVD
jgi:acid stress-induced BolA-like protein IbaG/YrbA